MATFGNRAATPASIVKGRKCRSCILKPKIAAGRVKRLPGLGLAFRVRGATEDLIGIRASPAGGGAARAAGGAASGWTASSSIRIIRPGRSRRSSFRGRSPGAEPARALRAGAAQEPGIRPAGGNPRISHQKNRESLIRTPAKSSPQIRDFLTGLAESSDLRRVSTSSLQCSV